MHAQKCNCLGNVLKGIIENFVTITPNECTNRQDETRPRGGLLLNLPPAGIAVGGDGKEGVERQAGRLVEINPQPPRPHRLEQRVTMTVGQLVGHRLDDSARTLEKNGGHEHAWVCQFQRTTDEQAHGNGMIVIRRGPTATCVQVPLPSNSGWKFLRHAGLLASDVVHSDGPGHLPGC